MKLISIVTPCFNEEGNVEELYIRVKHIFIDNDSTDDTVPILKRLARDDINVKIIVNARNFGHIRSPYYAILQASGEAVILIVADLQDPTEMIPGFIKKWEEGYKVVLGVKVTSGESFLMFNIRKMYYNFINRVSEIELTKNNTGFGLYDKRIIEILRQVDDPYPYFRGLISDIGFESFKIEYKQPARKRGLRIEWIISSAFRTRFKSGYESIIGENQAWSIHPWISTGLRLRVQGKSFIWLSRD